MLAVHHPLCFTYNRALRHSSIAIFGMHRASALERNFCKSTNRGTCFEDSDMLKNTEVAAFDML